MRYNPYERSTNTYDGITCYKIRGLSIDEHHNYYSIGYGCNHSVEQELGTYGLGPCYLISTLLYHMLLPLLLLLYLTPLLPPHLVLLLVLY